MELRIMMKQGQTVYWSELIGKYGRIDKKIDKLRDRLPIRQLIYEDDFNEQIVQQKISQKSRHIELGPEMINTVTVNFVN